MKHPNKSFTRREFLRGITAAGAAAAFIPRGYAFAGGANCEAIDRVLVVLHLNGGVCNTSLLPPRDGAVFDAYRSQYPTLHIPLAQQLPLTPLVGLHPAMENLHKIYTGTAGLDGIGMAMFNQVGFLHANGADATDRSHEIAIQQHAAGNITPGQGDGSGWVGRFAQEYCTSDYNIINLGGISRFSRAADVPVLSGRRLADFPYVNDGFAGPTFNQFRRDMAVALNAGAATNSHPAQLMFRATSESAHGASERLGAIQAAYQADPPPPGTYLDRPGDLWNLNGKFKDVAALIRGIGQSRVRVVTLEVIGFDTHSGQGALLNGEYSSLPTANGSYLGPQADLIDKVDRGIYGFFRDLQRLRSAGHAIPEVVVLVTSEVGRSFENQDHLNGLPHFGTDHGQSGACLVVGSGVRNQVGYANYTTSKFTNVPQYERWLRGEMDVRMIYRDIVENYLNRNGSMIFPGNYPTQYVAGGSIFI